MEGLVNYLKSCYAGKTVLVTGDTGFKGSWLCEWLMSLGANVHGYALEPPTRPSLFEKLFLRKRIASHQFGDVSDTGGTRQAIIRVSPDYVFHLAAQPIVHTGYAWPVMTYASNVMGTVNVLDGIRTLKKPCSVVVVTSDKCYDNKHWSYGYRESDSLGGDDPYSSSKAMAEIAVRAYRCSYFNDGTVRVATARAGNVIGGGDWSLHRIVPDCMKALGNDESIVVRNPEYTRPWQHVLDALYGYMLLMAKMSEHHDVELESAFNFGPDADRTVQDLVEEIIKHWPGKWRKFDHESIMHESGRLSVCTDKAKRLLRWTPVWNFETSVRHTAEWYRGERNSRVDVCAMTQRQIKEFEGSHVAG